MNNFLPRKFHNFFIIILIILLLLGSWLPLLILLCLYGISFIFFRKSNISKFSGSELSQGVLFSPINGKVMNIAKDIDHPSFGKNLTLIHIALPWWSEAGIYLPSACEVKDISQAKVENHFRYKNNLTNNKSIIESGLAISLLNKAGDTVGLQLVKCPLGNNPEVGVLPGDRGKAKANIGYFPFGGSLLLYIPDNYKIMINTKDVIVAGVTIIGGE